MVSRTPCLELQGEEIANKCDWGLEAAVDLIDRGVGDDLRFDQGPSEKEIDPYTVLSLDWRLALDQGESAASSPLVDAIRQDPVSAILKLAD